MYDLALFESFMNIAVKFSVPIQVGVVVLKSPLMGVYMNKNVSGLQVPQAWIEEIGSVDKTGRFLNQVKSMVQGVHSMPLGWTDIVPVILEQVDIPFERDKAA